MSADPKVLRDAARLLRSAGKKLDRLAGYMEGDLIEGQDLQTAIHEVRANIEAAKARIY